MTNYAIQILEQELLHKSLFGLDKEKEEIKEAIDFLKKNEEVDEKGGGREEKKIINMEQIYGLRE